MQVYTPSAGSNSVLEALLTAPPGQSPQRLWTELPKCSNIAYPLASLTTSLRKQSPHAITQSMISVATGAGCKGNHGVRNGNQFLGPGTGTIENRNRNRSKNVTQTKAKRKRNRNQKRNLGARTRTSQSGGPKIGPCPEQLFCNFPVAHSTHSSPCTTTSSTTTSSFALPRVTSSYYFYYAFCSYYSLLLCLRTLPPVSVPAPPPPPTRTVCYNHDCHSYDCDDYDDDATSITAATALTSTTTGWRLINDRGNFGAEPTFIPRTLLQAFETHKDLGSRMEGGGVHGFRFRMRSLRNLYNEGLRVYGPRLGLKIWSLNLLRSQSASHSLPSMIPVAEPLGCSLPLSHVWPSFKIRI